MSAQSKLKRYPASASPEYTAARDKLLDAEFALRSQIEEVAKLRRTLPPGGVMKEYSFTEGPADIHDTSGPVKKTTLADIVADGRPLAVYHMMFAAKDKTPCTLCGNFVDGINGVGQHLAQRTNFAIIAKAPVEQLRAYAARRGWTNLRFLSSYDTDFNGDMHVEWPEHEPDADQYPGVSVFVKDGGNVRHVYSQGALFPGGEQRGLDLLNPFWNMLDLVPEGRGEDWYPGDEYLKMAKE
jgi:predicted dithiol-disulfide oxidoreductase (DUF899 family)